MQQSTLYLAEIVIAGQEGFRSEPYLDTHGLWTIGFGFRFLLNGEVVTHDSPWMLRGDADTLLTHRVLALGEQVEHAVPVDLNSHQWAALVDFAYNIGMPAFLGSTVCRLLNHDDWHGAANAFLLWDKVTDPHTHALVVSAGLKQRRTMERTMFLGSGLVPLKETA